MADENKKTVKNLQENVSKKLEDIHKEEAYKGIPAEAITAYKKNVAALLKGIELKDKDELKLDAGKDYDELVTYLAETGLEELKDAELTPLKQQQNAFDKTVDLLDESLEKDLAAYKEKIATIRKDKLSFHEPKTLEGKGAIIAALQEQITTLNHRNKEKKDYKNVVVDWDKVKNLLPDGLKLQGKEVPNLKDAIVKAHNKQKDHKYGKDCIEVVTACQIIMRDSELSKGDNKEKREAAYKHIASEIYADVDGEKFKTEDDLKKDIEKEFNRGLGSKTHETVKNGTWVSVAIGAVATALGLKLAFAKGEEVDPNAQEEGQKQGSWFKKAVGFIVAAAGLYAVVVGGKSWVERSKQNKAAREMPAVGV